MADRISQLQEQLNLLAEHLCNAIGVLQQEAPASSLAGLEKLHKEENSPQDENIALFSQLIVHTCKDIDLLIDSLPDDDLLNPEEQFNRIRVLESENQDLNKKLEKAMRNADCLHKNIERKLSNLCEAKLEIQKIEYDEYQNRLNSSQS